MAKEATRAPYRQRFFSSMDYEEYVMHFGPPKPLLKYLKHSFRPSADPELLDNFQLNPESKYEPVVRVGNGQHHLFSCLPTIRETRIEEENSNTHTQRFQSPVMEFEEQPRSLKRPHSRMRSQSQNHAYLIFNFLDRPQAMQTKKMKMNDPC